MSDSEPIRFGPRLAGPVTPTPSNAPPQSARALPGKVCSGFPDRSATKQSSRVVLRSDLNQNDPSPRTAFDRNELKAILDLYGRKVAAGDWRDYAIDFLKDRAVFSVFRRSCEVPLYRIEKNPQLARKQGAYSVIAPGGLIMKRGHDLRRVLGVLESKLELAGQ